MVMFQNCVNVPEGSLSSLNDLMMFHPGWDSRRSHGHRGEDGSTLKEETLSAPGTALEDVGSSRVVSLASGVGKIMIKFCKNILLKVITCEQWAILKRLWYTGYGPSLGLSCLQRHMNYSGYGALTMLCMSGCYRETSLKFRFAFLHLCLIDFNCIPFIWWVVTTYFFW